MALDRLILNRNKFKKNCEAFDIKGAHGSFFQTMNLYNSLAKTIYFLFFINTIKEDYTIHVKPPNQQKIMIGSMYFLYKNYLQPFDKILSISIPINRSNFLPLLSLKIN